ncbi:MAG: phosphorylase [Limnospira sp. PMC 1291.21]|uniref:Ap4A phosphorylase II n=2 Tax=Limnospira TaxID=2596745 RepID=B5W7K3_LIMMA|nr:MULTISPECIES: phosphorylase [Limnospira]EKD05843.1 Ap4A phosphorylase II [Arthrospira platensis C1]MDC0836621.1 phosphorylase [Limnoraphis robusta]MDY7052643.1 phosphorylase [Limnospira fusiformis LS22]QJB27124.1 phosphorylase [Limnospira fusiformis SAG 85.79]EDZ92505.1 Ap4A phosphorylase II [Limnospira maxima CS-328]
MLEPGTLLLKLQQQTARALEVGALQPISTHYQLIEQAEIPFLVRVIDNLQRKATVQEKQEKTQTATGVEFNPFLPYDPDLFVENLSATHVGLLNKFNVVDYHLLIVTRDFQEQDSLLTLEDFEAMWLALTEIDGLAFYNGGREAGASQRHKHLQLVPFPLIPNGLNVPIEKAIASSIFSGSIGKIPPFEFRHTLSLFEPGLVNDYKLAAQVTLAEYLKSLDFLKISINDNGKPATHYNLLATRNWLLIIPRSQESWDDISVNSLGFAGALLVRNHQQLAQLKQQQPLTILKSVAFPI